MPELVKESNHPQSNFFIIWDDGDEVRLFHASYALNYNYALEIWHDHKHDGNGCNNLRLDAFGRELDLEFCRSRALTEEETQEIIELAKANNIEAKEGIIPLSPTGEMKPLRY